MSSSSTMENHSHKLPAAVPLGNSGTLSGIAENFAFHASPESFIAKVWRDSSTNSEIAEQHRIPIRAKILNRNVAVISSYKQVEHVLNNTSTTEAAPSYMQLMEPFFPIPNLLLKDGCPHAPARATWQPLANNLRDQKKCLTDLADKYFQTIPTDSPCDLYKSMKDLSWMILLGVFLDLSPADSLYQDFVTLHEKLLRGQFSLLPVAFSVGIWKSPRQVGIDARRSLQRLIRSRISTNPPAWLPRSVIDADPDEATNHVLMYTSSLAVKSLASLLTALFLNLARLGWSSELDFGKILDETARLSPPIVGVMRRAVCDTTVPANGTGPDTLVPQGWDIWCYFPGANRDSAVYGDDAQIFQDKRRNANAPVPPPFIFGAGAKKCLGSGIIMSACLAAVDAMRNRNLYVEATAEEPGVRAWLGWERAALSDWTRDMKQLPTQRPTEPITALFRSYTPS